MLRIVTGAMRTCAGTSKRRVGRESFELTSLVGPVASLPLLGLGIVISSSLMHESLRSRLLNKTYERNLVHLETRVSTGRKL